MKVLDKGYVELLDNMGDDLTIVNAARVSYLGESKGSDKDKRLLKYLWVNRHTSPFEQVEFQFLVKCPLFVARQWHRHRTWSYNEISRRYTSEQLEFYTPIKWRMQSSDNKQMSDSFLDDDELSDALKDSLEYAIEYHCLYLYDTLIKHGVAREQARMILPQSMYTTFYAKVDLHNLLHFIELRAHKHAQYEIQLYTAALLKLIDNYVPWTVEIFLNDLELEDYPLLGQ